MNGSKPTLQAHLLTRTDLAAMAIPAATVLRWLGDGSLEEVGRLPSDADSGEPVFTVLRDELRGELIDRLAAIGKPAVVLTPDGVRAFLLRSLLPAHGADAVRPVDVRPVDDEPAATPAGDADAQATAPLATADLATVLHEATNDVAADVETMLRLAAEIAATEQTAARVGDESTAAPMGGAHDARDLAPPVASDGDDPARADLESDADEAPREPGAADDPEEAVFDFDALADEFATRSHAPAADDFAADAEAADGPAPVDDRVAPVEPTPTPAATPVTAVDAAQAAPEPEAVPPAGAAQANATPAVVTPPAGDRVHEFLGAIERALIDVAQRPGPERVDVEPLVAAVQAGFENSAKQATDTSSALTALTDRLSRFGDQVERGMAQTVQSVLDRTVAARPTPAPQPAFVSAHSQRSTLVLSALAVVAVAWAIVFWLKTGSPRLALAALIAANAVGCCLLMALPRRI